MAIGRWISASLVVGLVCVSLPASAEVMDKEPTLAEIWRLALVGAAAALALARIHPALGIPALLWGSGPLNEVWDPFVGPAIRREAGLGYIHQVYEAAGLVLLGYALGVIWWSLARRNKRVRSVPA